MFLKIVKKERKLTMSIRGSTSNWHLLKLFIGHTVIKAGYIIRVGPSLLGVAHGEFARRGIPWNRIDKSLRPEIWKPQLTKVIKSSYAAHLTTLTFLNQVNISSDFMTQVPFFCFIGLKNDNICRFRELYFHCSTKVLIQIWWPYN